MKSLLSEKARAAHCRVLAAAGVLGIVCALGVGGCVSVSDAEIRSAWEPEMNALGMTVEKVYRRCQETAYQVFDHDEAAREKRFRGCMHELGFRDRAK